MKGKAGFALVIVLVAVTLLVSLVTVFISEVYLEAGSARASIDSTQGGLYAEGGITGARQLLSVELASRSYTTLEDSWSKPIVIKEPKGNGKLTVTIEDESAKFNLNSISLPNGTDNTQYFETGKRLFKALKLPSEPLEAIADWIDEGAVPRPGGAEADWYKSGKLPYTPRNKPLLTLEEVKRVKGVAGIYEIMRPFVTVYSEQGYGAPASPVNINTAPKEVLMALDERISSQMADRIIQFRKETPFQNPAELTQVPGMEQITTQLLTRISTKGSVFRIRSDCYINGITRSIEAVLKISGSVSSILYWREY